MNAKTVLLNLVLNSLLTILFVYANMWALDAGLEETFVALAISFGIVVIAGNALFLLAIQKPFSQQY
ncbi:MAG: hypothetical protein R3C44_20085 [Chloroflexota bacterium]